MKLKDLLNHITGYSDIVGIEIRYKLIPIDSALFPQCLRNPHDDEIWTRYGNDTLWSFAVVDHALIVNIGRDSMEDQAKTPYVVRYRYKDIHKRYEHTERMPVEFRCETERQMDHVIAYVTGHPDTYELIDPVRR